jgi:hypothetical protein
MLSSILFESATLVGVPKVSEEMLAKYGYNSEHRIAMESAVELNDIFYESFYKMEELDFQHAYATMEGADESVLEGIVSSMSERAKGAIEKIKTFLRDLWKKVQAFFHNVKRFLDGIFMNAQDFVKKYESELLKLTFKDKPYTVDVYDYDLDDCKSMALTTNKCCTELIGGGADAIKSAKALAVELTGQLPAFDGSVDGKVKSPTDKSTDSAKNAARKRVDDNCEKMLKGVAGVITGEYGKYLKTSKGEDPTAAEVAEAEWRRIRKGASGESDKKSVTITSLTPYVKFLKTSKTALSNFDKTAKTIDDMYKGVLARISDAEKIINDSKGDDITKELILKVSSGYSKVVSKMQGWSNAIVSENRKALQEKIAVYKKICTSAFAHADKDSKK